MLILFFLLDTVIMYPVYTETKIKQRQHQWAMFEKVTKNIGHSKFYTQ